MINDKDFVAIENFLEGFPMPQDLKDIMMDLPNQFGTVSVIDAARKREGIPDDAKAALENLKQVMIS